MAHLKILAAFALEFGGKWGREGALKALVVLNLSFLRRLYTI